MAFNGNMANDEAYVNGIGRFEIQVNDAAAEVVWSQSMSCYLCLIFPYGYHVHTFDSYRPRLGVYRPRTDVMKPVMTFWFFWKIFSKFTMSFWVNFISKSLKNFH